MSRLTRVDLAVAGAIVALLVVGAAGVVTLRLLDGLDDIDLTDLTDQPEGLTL